MNYAGDMFTGIGCQSGSLVQLWAAQVCHQGWVQLTGSVHRKAVMGRGLPEVGDVAEGVEADRSENP